MRYEWTHFLGTALLGFVVLSLLNIVVVAVITISLPVDYLQTERRQRAFRDKDWALQVSIALKNIVGVGLIGFGIALLFLPGPGLLTMLCGLILTDFPFKRRYELKLMSQPRVLGTVNQIRGFFKRKPIQAPSKTEG